MSDNKNIRHKKQAKNVVKKNDMPKKEVSDEELIRSVKDKKSYEAFEKLMSRYERPIYNLSFKFTRNKESAEEVTQDTFLSVFRNLDNFREEASFKTWLYRVATNFALMKIRKNKRLKEVFSDESLLQKDNEIECVSHRKYEPEGILEKVELAEFIGKALSKLSPVYRSAFLLRDIEGFSNQEAADMLGISLSAIKSRVLRARLNIRDYLKGLLED